MFPTLVLDNGKEADVIAPSDNPRHITAHASFARGGQYLRGHVLTLSCEMNIVKALLSTVRS